MNLVYFCDEASFLEEEYMGVAGLAISRSRITATVKHLDKLKDDLRYRGEVKWGNTRKTGIAIRKAYLDHLAQLIRDNHAHFHIRFSPMNEYDHEGPRKRFDTASKSFYQLLLHRAVRYYGNQCKIFIRPDNGECTRLLPDLHDWLHTDGAYRYKTPLDCIDSIVCLDSKKEPMLQLLDVALGALTAVRNGRHALEKVAAPKKELAPYAIQALGIRSLNGNRDDGNKFSIWNVVPKKNKRAA